MSPTTGIWVELDSPVKSFFPGQTISGVVVIENEKSLETTGVVIKFEGKVKVNWSERTTRKEGRSHKFVTVFYTAEETYFKQEILLWGSSASSQDKIILPRGRSVYDFEYTLPTNLPSSFVSRIGTVSYSMDASLRLPWSRADVVCIVPFTVNGVLDLNVEPGAGLSYETRRYKSVCCCCCISGPVGFVFYLPRRGFVPGESIDFDVEINNQSSQRVYGMKVTLMQECKFHANGNSKVTLRSIRQVQGPQVDPGESEVWREKLLRIPPVPPSRLATCRMIDVQYFLKLEMTLPNMTLNLKDEVPITIGTIPLRDTFADLTSSSLMALPISTSDGQLNKSSSKPSLLSFTEDATLENSGEFCVGTPSKLHRPPARSRGYSISSEHPSFSEYPDLPPPSYQEAILLDKLPEEENQGFTAEELTRSDEDTNNIRVVNAKDNFIPQYVTYGVGNRNSPEQTIS